MFKNGYCAIGLMALVITAAPVYSQNIAPPEIAAQSKPAAENPLLQEFIIDRSERMTVPVQINNSKPYPFIVDTGSERTVIATDLAKSLALETGNSLRLATITGPQVVDSYIIDSLKTSTLNMENIEAPGLERANLGAFGLLGIDSLQENKVYLDLRAGTMEVLNSRRNEGRNSFERGMIVVSAKRKAGRLILSNAIMDGINVDIIIDTGSQNSLGNYKLRDILTRKNRIGAYAPVTMHSVTGDKIAAQRTLIRNISIAGMNISGLPIAFSENYAMKALGLNNRPAIFLGMDALQLFDKIAIDFVNKRVSFRLPSGVYRDTPARLATSDLIPPS
jgi:hypothetical protein